MGFHGGVFICIVMKLDRAKKMRHGDKVIVIGTLIDYGDDTVVSDDGYMKVKLDDDWHYVEYTRVFPASAYKQFFKKEWIPKVRSLAKELNKILDMLDNKNECKE